MLQSRIKFLASAVAVLLTCFAENPAHAQPAKVILVLQVEAKTNRAAQTAIVGRLATTAAEFGYLVKSPGGAQVVLSLHEQRWVVCDEDRGVQCGLQLNELHEGSLGIAAELNPLSAGCDVRVFLIDLQNLTELVSYNVHTPSMDELELARAAQEGARRLLTRTSEFPIWPTFAAGIVAVGSGVVGAVAYSQAIAASRSRATAPDDRTYIEADENLRGTVKSANISAAIGISSAVVAGALFVTYLLKGDSSALDRALRQPSNDDSAIRPERLGFAF